MKKVSTLLILLCFNFGLSQVNFGYNDKLLIQLSKNQGVRLTSNQLFLSNLRSQNEYYTSAKQKATQIMFIHDYIYDKLRNIHRNISQGKKLFYTLQYMDNIVQSSRELIEHTGQDPVIGAMLTTYYTHIIEEALSLQQILQSEILKEEDGFLMDAYDREILIDKIYTKVKGINSKMRYLSILIEARANKPLIYQMPLIGNYAIIDREMVMSIMQRWNWITN